MRGPMQQTTPDEARADALTLLATLTDRQLQARWNFGPTTGAILRAVAADPERVRCEAHYLSADEKHPATSTVYVRPPRPFRISRGPSQFDGSWDDNEYTHPDWCECEGLLRHVRDELGIDFQHGPDEIHPDALWSLSTQRLCDDEPESWFRLWWD